MTEKSRTEYSARNTTVAVVCKIVAILMGYVTRIVFTRTLSESYVGINGLFTDILYVLALSELGVGTAITYALYKPIAEHDEERQKSLMKLYSNIYKVVALVVLVAGLLVVPFMDVLIKNKPDVEGLTFIYLLYLANSVVSYLLIFKKTLIDAHQKLYIGTLYQTIFLLIQDVLQIVILLTTKNFILFLIIYILCTLGGNIAISHKANKLYPFLKDKNVKPLDKEERSSIFKNIKAMLMHKIGSVAVNNTDNLILSSIVGIASVGKYSNYYLLLGSIRQIMDQVFNGITASVGNLGATEKPERIRRIFDASFFVGYWMYGFSAICLYELLSPVVELSFGANYLFHSSVVLVLCINFYITGMRKSTLVFRDSLGLFWHDRYKSIAEAVINLIVSIVLAMEFGTAGVFMGTIISTVFTSTWIEPYILFKHHLKQSVVPYFVKYVVYTLVMAGVFLVTDYFCSMINGGLIYTIGVRLAICIIVPNLVLLAVYFRTKEFGIIWQKAKSLINGRTEEKINEQ